MIDKALLRQELVEETNAKEFLKNKDRREFNTELDKLKSEAISRLMNIKDKQDDSGS